MVKLAQKMVGTATPGRGEVKGDPVPQGRERSDGILDRMSGQKLVCRPSGKNPEGPAQRRASQKMNPS